MKIKIRIKEKVFKNPLWTASGTFGYGREFEDFIDLNEVGAIITKTLTLEARQGNPPQRIVETASGMLNSIGLENKGIEHFKKEYYPYLRKLDTSTVISFAGSSMDDFIKCTEKFTGKDSPEAIEVNLSCPNVSHGDTRYKLMAQDPITTEKIIKEIKKRTDTLVIAKLTPNVTDITEIARAVEAAGADAVSLVNTYMGMAVDAEEMKPILGRVTGGLSGPAIKPLALKSVWDVYNNIKIPIIGIGGIMTGNDVVEFMLCGATAVQLGTSNLVDPASFSRIKEEFVAYLERKGIEDVNDLTGGLRIDPEG